MGYGRTAMSAYSHRPGRTRRKLELTDVRAIAVTEEHL